MLGFKAYWIVPRRLARAPLEAEVRDDRREQRIRGCHGRQRGERNQHGQESLPGQNFDTVLAT